MMQPIGMIILLYLVCPIDIIYPLLWPPATYLDVYPRVLNVRWPARFDTARVFSYGVSRAASRSLAWRRQR